MLEKSQSPKAFGKTQQTKDGLSPLITDRLLNTKKAAPQGTAFIFTLYICDLTSLRP